MNIDQDLIEKLSNLAKLEFNDDQKEKIRTDLEKILAFCEKLQEVDTEGVKPLIYVSEEVNRLREDAVQVDITQDEALKNAPAKDSDYFKVPKVIDK
jgi:aspartyl-tRNA(Asn)/glutamyl-tRNA(Gln) amidotransferase subunit C